MGIHLHPEDSRLLSVPRVIGVLQGTDPNGTWSLYIVNDFGHSGYGQITNGWSLTIKTNIPNSSDRFEPNNTENTATLLTSVDGTINEPDLSIHSREDVDFFQFTLNQIESSENFVQIDFEHELGDLDLELYINNNGIWQEIESSTSTSNQELISLADLEAGNYLVKVYGYDGATNPDYDLTLNIAQTTFIEK